MLTLGVCCSTEQSGPDMRTSVELGSAIISITFNLVVCVQASIIISWYYSILQLLFSRRTPTTFGLFDQFVVKQQHHLVYQNT